MIDNGGKLEGLYDLGAGSDAQIAAVNQVSLNIWHNRLDHPSVQVRNFEKSFRL